MKDVIKRSDCNHCANKNCPPHVYSRVKYDCKTFKPIEQGLSSPLRIAYFNNFEGLVETFQKAGLQLPKEAK